MDTLEAELSDALRQRIALIGDHILRAADPAAHLAQLRQASERITALQQRLPADTHIQLRHYFERCSYDNALAWLDQHDLTGSAK